MIYVPDDVNSWPVFKPLIIAHDVGRTRDRSTAVVGGNSPCGRRLLGIREAEELPQNLFGHARASALAAVDRRHNHNALIVADLSNDPTYAEVLVQTFGQRVIGLQISRYGDGMNAEWRPVRHGHSVAAVLRYRERSVVSTAPHSASLGKSFDRTLQPVEFIGRRNVAYARDFGLRSLSAPRMERNLEYIGHLAALRTWYLLVRRRRLPSGEFGHGDRRPAPDAQVLKS